MRWPRFRGAGILGTDRMNSFRLVVWNCNMALHGKYEQLLALDPSVAIIPECAEPEILARKAPDFEFRDVEWAGSYANKGLAVFSFGEHTLRRSDMWDPRYHIMLPLEVRGPSNLNLLAVWAFNHRVPPLVTPNPATTAAAVRHYDRFLKATSGCIAGDFNANVRWDGQGKYANFRELDETAKSIGLVSAYHSSTGEALGAESAPTLYFRKKRDDGYHIDYAYVPREWSERMSVRVGHPDEWLSHSDHSPLVIEFAAH